MRSDESRRGTHECVRHEPPTFSWLARELSAHGPLLLVAARIAVVEIGMRFGRDSRLILRRLLVDMIDHDHGHRALMHLQL
jgi:hypothetical protein